MSDVDFKSDVAVDILNLLPHLLKARERQILSLNKFHEKCFIDTVKHLDDVYEEKHTISWFSRVVLRRTQPALKKHTIEEGRDYFFSRYYLYSSVSDYIKSNRLNNIVTELNSLIEIAHKSEVEKLEIKVTLSKSIRDIILCM